MAAKSFSDFCERKKWDCDVRYHSSMGEVVRVHDGWKCRVRVGQVMGRIREVFDSAEVAMAAVERVWKRENQL